MHCCISQRCLAELVKSWVLVQEYLAHKRLTPLGPYGRTMPRALWWSLGRGGGILMSEVPL